MPFIPPLTFLRSEIPACAQVRMGIAAAKIFACMAHMPNNNYGYALDNSRKQYGVDEEYRVWVLDYDGFEVHDRGDKVEGVRCSHASHCRRSSCPLPHLSGGMVTWTSPVVLHVTAGGVHRGGGTCRSWWCTSKWWCTTTNRPQPLLQPPQTRLWGRL